LKWKRRDGAAKRAGRPSYEGRGLKYTDIIVVVYEGKSSLVRGTWIEMCLTSARFLDALSSLVRGTWIEI